MKTTTWLTLFALAALSVACSGSGAREVSTAPMPTITQEPTTTQEPTPAQAPTTAVTVDLAQEPEPDSRSAELASRLREVEAALEETPLFPARPEQIVALPAETELELELTAPLSSETSLVGDRVVALLSESLFAEGLEAIPAGSRVVGRVVEAVPQKKLGGRARLTLLFDRVEMPSGYRAEIQAPFEVTGIRQKKKDAATIGGAAAGGAVLGGILGKDKGKGALIGGLIGAAAGTIAARENRGDPVELDAGDRIRIVLELPLHVALNALDEKRPVVES